MVTGQGLRSPNEVKSVADLLMNNVEPGVGNNVVTYGARNSRECEYRGPIALTQVIRRTSLAAFFANLERKLL
jgi:hypothetical protein